VRNYYKKIKQPMDLGTIHERTTANKYTSVVHFMNDIKLIRDNSLAFNGPMSLYTCVAEEILTVAVEEVQVCCATLKLSSVFKLTETSI
jgi:hypothetical protein